MCSEFFHSEERRAAKPHECYECRVTIQPGRRYERIFAVTDGQPSASALCLRCARLSDVVFDEVGEEACYTSRREIARELARDLGWRRLLAAFRNYRTAVRAATLARAS